MLSLITWRFNGSLHNLLARRLPPPDLLQHLSTSAINDVCENIVANYSRYLGQTTSLKVLTTKFRMLVHLILNDFLSHFSEPLCTEDMILFLLYYIYGNQRVWQTNQLVSPCTSRGYKYYDSHYPAAVIFNNPPKDRTSKIILSCVCEVKHHPLKDLAIGNLKGATVAKSFQPTVIITWTMLPPWSCQGDRLRGG